MNTAPCRILLFHSVPSKDSYSDSDFRITLLGLFFMAGALRKNGFEPLILPILLPIFLDESTPAHGYRKELQDKIQDFNPDYIGYSFRNLYNFGPPVVYPWQRHGSGRSGRNHAVSQDRSYKTVLPPLVLRSLG